MGGGVVSKNGRWSSFFKVVGGVVSLCGRWSIFLKG
jgi:hypothetical protein